MTYECPVSSCRARQLFQYFRPNLQELFDVAATIWLPGSAGPRASTGDSCGEKRPYLSNWCTGDGLKNVGALGRQGAALGLHADDPNKLVSGSPSALARVFYALARRDR
jgi:hypothetical protein